jgi:hypothetical protein
MLLLLEFSSTGEPHCKQLCARIPIFPKLANFAYDSTTASLLTVMLTKLHCFDAKAWDINATPGCFDVAMA